jgi:ribosome maturation factor RimP
MNGGFMISENEIYQAFDSYLNQENLELYDLNLVFTPNLQKVEVYVYSIEEVDIALTSRLNTQLQRILSDFEIEKGSYEMIVSSPGIERKLKSPRHFELALGELVKVKLYRPINNEYSFEGVISNISANSIVLSINNEDLNVKIENIKNAKIEFKQFKEKVKG